MNYFPHHFLVDCYFNILKVYFYVMNALTIQVHACVGRLFFVVFLFYQYKFFMLRICHVFMVKDHIIVTHQHVGQ